MSNKHAKLKLSQSKFFPDFPDVKGKGLVRHLTDEVFIQSIENEALEEKNQAREKSQRSKMWEVKQIVRDACKQEWKASKIAHDQAVEAWKVKLVKCEIMKAVGT